ncbi:MAG: winged helix-turn-helix transcriptional regulator [Christensenellaceae bacterium]|nr:winged helix-turn-helix transcriptional regulator [Christensenellaceae bacterium]
MSDGKLTNEEIAERLYLTISTLKRYIKKIDLLAERLCHVK